jgi:hypothetical protein
MTPLILLGAALALLVLFFVLNQRAGRDRAVRPVRARGATALPRSPASPKRRMRRDVPHALYAYGHRFGGYVYVGISNDPEARHSRRMAEFAAGNPRVAWVAESTGDMQVISWYPDWATARIAEDALIARLALEGHPVANDQGNPLRRSRRAA